eukprot:TRINITY_DN7164_c0_g1_i2.p1 TRINITY_DN7164_c0_g1~~TRINITY_DN7164_c0_g1_i2.p1  ORF type:complete len:999 (-),score=148.49 TRINITY_DN7164_c0_g1_i2:58-3054(-)
MNFALFVLFSVLPLIHANLTEEQVRTLQELFGSTNGPQWKNKTNWNNGYDPCGNATANVTNWEGVVCAATDNTFTVVNLVLAANNLVGGLPAKLFQLFPYLEQILIQGNQISGALPDLSMNTRLKGLIASDNKFSGVAKGIWASTTMVQIDLHNNPDLTGSIEDGIQQMSQLSSLDLSYCQFTGTIPDGLDNLLSLQNVFLQNNKFSGTIPASIFSTALVKFQLQQNGFTGPIPTTIALAHDLQLFYVDTNQLNGPIPAEVCGLTNLQAFHVQVNQLESIPDCFGTNLTRVSEVLLANNAIAGTLSVGICNMHALTLFQIQNNRDLGGTLPNCIGNWTKISSLIIEVTGVSGTLPATLAGLHQLQLLILSQSQFSGTIPDSFGNLQRLQALVLNGNPPNTNPSNWFVGSIPPSVSQLSTLVTLYLAYNQLNGTLPDLTQLSHLQKLALNNNAFSGSLPNSMLQLFQNPIPNCGGDCTRQLHLEFNQFTGTIPLAFANMNTPQSNLTELQIHDNMFYGYVPHYFNHTDIPWLQPDSGGYSAFLTNLRLFSPVVDWANLNLGATAFMPSVQTFSPAIGSLFTATTVNMTVDWIPNDPRIYCGFCVPYGNVTCTGDQDFIASKATVLDSATLTCDTPTTLPMWGMAKVVLLFQGDDYVTPNSVHIISQVAPLNFFFYHPHPTLYELEPLAGRHQGCITVTVRGANISDTGEMLKCRVGDIDTAVAWVSAQELRCNIASGPLPPPQPNKLQLVEVSPNNWTTKSTGAVHFTFEEYCPLAPALARRKDCPCGLCPCNSVGTCFTNASNYENPWFCDCSEGFNGTTCQQCEPFFGGEDCVACPHCVHGVCFDGKVGDAECYCSRWYMGKTCSFRYYYFVVIAGPLVGTSLFVGIMLVVAKCYSRKRRGTGEPEAEPLLDQSEHDDEPPEAFDEEEAAAGSSMFASGRGEKEKEKERETDEESGNESDGQGGSDGDDEPRPPTDDAIDPEEPSPSTTVRVLEGVQ